jgi:hypothetical protein
LNVNSVAFGNESADFQANGSQSIQDLCALRSAKRQASMECAGGRRRLGLSSERQAIHTGFICVAVGEAPGRRWDVRKAGETVGGLTSSLTTTNERNQEKQLGVRDRMRLSVTLRNTATILDVKSEVPSSLAHD